jgi:pyruvate dehydrogenase E2 component (dihydrolipoamide acetyltransferase)
MTTQNELKVDLGGLMHRLREIALRGNPAECAEPMSGVSTQVRGLRSESVFGGLRLVIDEPEVFGGTGSAPNPAQVALAALGASLEVTLRCYAEYFGIPIEGISVELAGALDSRGFFGTDSSVRAGFQSIDATVRVRSSAPMAQIEKLMTHVEACCPVLDLLRAPTPVNLRIRRDASGD